MHPRLLVAAALAVGPFAPADAQQPQPLGRPLLEYAEPFSIITAIRELQDGRLVVADSREKTLQILNLATGATRPISREGRGPGEYLSVAALLPMPDDQTLVVDVGNRRFLRLDRSGSAVETVAVPNLSGGPAVAGESPLLNISALSVLPPRGVDRLGRLHFNRLVLPRPGSPAPPSDSAAILRWVPGQAAVDSVGWVNVNASRAMWAPAEAWQVMPDGRIARLLPAPYQVMLVDGSGRRTLGPVVPYTPIRVTEAEKDQARKDRASRMAQMGQMMQTEARAAGGGGAAPAMPAMADIEFAETKPPFYGTQSVTVAPDGQIWVLRTRAFGDEVPVYDVFDETGRLHRRVSLAPRARLVGFGTGVVYVARVDDDDLEWLQKYARP